MNKQFSIHLIGHQKPDSVKVYCFPVFSFAFLLTGEALVSVEDKNILLTAGQFIMIPENKSIIIKHYKAVIIYSFFNTFLISIFIRYP